MTDSRSNATRTGLAVLAFALVVSLSTYRTLSVLNVPGEPSETDWGMQDFRDAIYYPAVAFLNGDNPYNTPEYMAKYDSQVRQLFPLYSPLTLLVHLPLALLPFEAAEAVYFGGMVVLCMVLAWMALKFSGLPCQPWQVLALAALILISRPGHKNLIVGQSTLQAVVFSLLALEYARRRPRLSGVALALSTFKPTFGVPLFVLMLCRGNVRACVWALIVGGIATLSVVGVLAHSAGGLTELITAIPENRDTFKAHPGAHPLTSYARVDLFAFACRFARSVPRSLVEFLLGAIILVLGAFTLRRISSKIDEGGSVGLSGVVICLTILLSIYHQTYDLLLLVPAFVAVAAAQGSWAGLGAAPRRVLIACFTVLAVNYAASATGLRVLGLEDRFESGLWIAASSVNGLMLLTIYAVCAWMTLRKEPQGIEAGEQLAHA